MVESSVIIPCWIFDITLLKLTERCIYSVRETSDVELIIIDNGSTLGSQLLKQEADVYIRNKENLGYVEALNQGIRVSTGKYLVGGNNDVTVPDDWEATFKDILNTAKDCGTITACDTLEDKPKEANLWKVSGALRHWFMIRREVLLKIGLFDERFFNAWADLDYAFRLEKEGLHPLITSDVIIEHYGRATRDKWSGEKSDYEQGRKKLIEKWKDSQGGQNLLKDYCMI